MQSTAWDPLSILSYQVYQQQHRFIISSFDPAKSTILERGFSWSFVPFEADTGTAVHVWASPADIRKVYVPACTQKTPNLRFCFLKRRLTNTLRCQRLADGQLSSPYPPSPSFTSFGAAAVMLCCFPPALSNTALPMLLYVAPSILQLRSKGQPCLPSPCLASFLLTFLLCPLWLASSFLPCLTSSALARFLLPSLPRPLPSSISPQGRVAKQAAGI